jgi:hypothetical protein
MSDLCRTFRLMTEQAGTELLYRYAAIALPEPPESIVALAAGNGSTKLEAAARHLVKP